MGLSIVHGMVKSYDGAITLESRPREGNQFAIYLPRMSETIDEKLEAA